MIPALTLAAGAAAALALGIADLPRALRGRVHPEQPVLLVLASTGFAWLSFAVWPQ